jgi:flagellar FliL protein
MGEFSLTAFQPTSNSTLRIDFHLFGTVRAGEEKEFARLMEESKHRIREQVLMTVRSADITDLADPGLGLVKRQILDKTNRTLGKPLLHAVIISDFSFVEQ